MFCALAWRITVQCVRVLKRIADSRLACSGDSSGPYEAFDHVVILERAGCSRLDEGRGSNRALLFGHVAWLHQHLSPSSR